MSFDPKAPPAKRVAAVQRLITELSGDDRPILVGPWRTEVGFESLYWIPFLTRLAKAVPKFDQRAVVVTRGGLAPLYSLCAANGYDLYALRSVTDVRRENAFDHRIRNEGKTVKQLAITEWDEAVLEEASQAVGKAGLYHTVHPSWMYWALAPFWEEQAGLNYLLSLTDYTPLPKIAIAGDLPPSYVAMKWYGRATFPYPDPVVAEFVQHVVATVAQQVPVVLVNTGSEHDDHVDIPVVGDNVHLLPKDLAPEENLKIQAAVIGGAKAFVGTYGGMSQLALRLGIPSVSFYAEFGGTAHAHLSLSSWLSKQMNVPFVAMGLQDSVLSRQVLAGKVGKVFGQAA